MGRMNHDEVAPAGALPVVTDSRPAGVRTISSVEELRALSDPIRLAILEKLMMSAPDQPDLPIMSVKELAEALGEPQTKLYRHIRQLESVGLIKVAASRLVSGILEQRYQAAQRDMDLAPGFIGESIDEAEGITRAVLDRFRMGFFAAYRVTHTPAGTTEGKASLMYGAARLAPAKAAEVKAKLAEVLSYFDKSDSDDPDAEELNLLVGYYSPVENGSLHTKRQS
jgi:DNA-binding transcriptional ArsR family regulator